MVSKMYASVCKCKNKSIRRSTSLLLNGLSPGISKGMFLCIITSVYYHITAQMFEKRGATFVDSLLTRVGGIF